MIEPDRAVSSYDCVTGTIYLGGAGVEQNGGLLTLNCADRLMDDWSDRHGLSRGGPYWPVLRPTVARACRCTTRLSDTTWGRATLRV